MPGFADSFWSNDYAAGLGVLFGKLQQGVIENQQVLTIARMRADAEELYGARLGDISPAVDRMSGGFARDDGATVRKAYEGIRSEMEGASRSHRKIAANIRELVVYPFSRWCDAHEARIQQAQDELQAQIKEHDKQADVARKCRSHYFNKCRLLEDLEEEDKLAFKEPQSESSPKKQQVPELKVTETGEEEDEDPIEIGDEVYQPEELKKILRHMLETIKLGETRVPILGTYQNVSTGVDIVEYIQTHMKATTVSYAERIGQDLVQNGFLRLVGNVGNTFANSSKMNYQWRPKAFKWSGVPDKKKALERVSTLRSNGDNSESPTTTSVGDYLAGWNPLSNPHPNETPGEKLRREVREADERYKAAIRKLDLLRCSLEEAIMDTLKYLEKCELDRLKAIKTVILDFAGAVSNVIPTLQSAVDQMMLYQETIQPLADMRYTLETYRTGAFLPKVQVYENYYNSADDQTFGADIEARARADRKRVPIIVTTMLTYLDSRYPDLEGDEARQGIWLVNVPLAATHHLRNSINNGRPIPHEILERYDIPVVASALKLYLLELPDSLISSNAYEIVKTIYSTQASEADDSARISVIQNTLSQLRLANIATLDAIITHFTRLIELTSADEMYISSLASALAPCILRPRTESSLTLHERYSYRLIRDLLAHKDAIFGELKRASSFSQFSSSSRARAISTNERDRRANMEARAQAIMSRSRASSPQPQPGRNHRRDRSMGGVATRFPVQTSPPLGSHRKAAARQSLEVPGGGGSSSGSNGGGGGDVGSADADGEDGKANGPPAAAAAAGAAESGDRGSSSSSTEGQADEAGAPAAVSSPVVNSPVAMIDKRNSLGRSSAVYSGKFPRRVPPVASARHGSLSGASKRDSLSGQSVDEAEAPQRPVGVTLTDKPVDD